jgi:hypothetical protein
MGFLDKAKEAADRAVAATQQAAQQGQAKVQTFQSSKSEGDLFKALGEAFFNEQRRGGDRAAVVDALAAVDQHYASVAAAQAAQAAPPAPAAPAAGYGSPAPAAPGAPTPPPAPPAAAPSGNFTLDDL